MENIEKLVEEFKSNPEYYVRLLLRLREQVASLTIMNQECQVALDMEVSKVIELKNAFETKEKNN